VLVPAARSARQSSDCRATAALLVVDCFGEFVLGHAGAALDALLLGDVLWIDDGQWSAPPAGWGDRLAEYRSYLVNHLVGHWLGVPETGCGGGPAPVMSDQTAGLGGCAPEPWPSPAERDRARMRHIPTFTVAFGGDVHGEGRVREHLLRGGNPLELVSPVLAAADLAVVNLETAVGTTRSPQQGKSFTFQAPPQHLTALDAAGVDPVSPRPTKRPRRRRPFGPPGARLTSSW
jgi:hypothetical protein